MSTICQRQQGYTTGAVSGPLRVIIADRHAPFRRMLAELLGSEPNVRIVAITGDGSEALCQAEALRPDVILLDLDLPGAQGLEAARWISSHIPGVRVVLLADGDGPEYWAAARQSGAAAFLAKQRAGEELPNLLNALGTRRS